MALKSKNGTAFYERGSWYHRMRYYDQDFLVHYGKRGGFQSEKEAEASYEQYLHAFETQKKRLRQKKDESIELKPYLENWLLSQEHFTAITKTIYRHVLGQAFLYMPDVKLCFVGEDYINASIHFITNRTSSYGLKLYELFNMALADAFSEGLIENNPMLGVRQPRRERIEFHLLDHEEKRQFLQYARYSNWYLEILLGMFCGLKKSEIYGLKFSDFDLDAETVTIKRKVVAEYTKDQNRKTEYRMLEKSIPDGNARRTLKVPKEIFANWN